jgi:hypothetical protein
MLNAAPPPALVPVIDYADPLLADRMANGTMNTDDATILAHIRSSIRRGVPQMRTGPVRPDRVCLVGSGPSLLETERELRDLVFAGAKVVTLNGAYQWCLDRNIKPDTQIVMDARPSNARFLDPALPQCRYVLASQCAPAVWDAVEGRPQVWIFHAVLRQESEASTILDAYYGGHWIGIGGGTTVATRAINLLRTVGYVRFDLFGIDCCWHGDQHHAFEQPENDHDRPVKMWVGAKGQPATPFLVTPWMAKQFEDFLQTIRVNGQHFQLEVHGKGLLAFALRTLGAADLDQLSVTKE